MVHVHSAAARERRHSRAVQRGYVRLGGAGANDPDLRGRMVDISRSLRVHRGHVVATGKAIHNPSHAAGVAAAMGVISSGERRSAQEVHRRANAARHAWADVLDEDCADDGGEGRGRAGATEQRGQCPHVVNVGTQTEEVGGADSRPPQDDGRAEGIARAPLPAAERPSDRSCETVSVETIAAMERRLQRLEQVEVDALLAGRIADYGVALEDAAKRITDLEMEGAASERRIMEQVSQLTDSFPDIVVKAVGNTCRPLLSDVAQTAQAHIAKVRAEIHDSLAELATLTYRVGDEVEVNGLQNLPDLNGRRGSVVQLFSARARIGVQVDGHAEPKALRPGNLQRLHTTPALLEDTLLATRMVA
mmetsp:Transcript_29864/g.85191  ORF Transcript_29864/g.85191 Transcript_29864/m.85191 type:complete len:362 (-) Transcript_29864:149-1234(-)